jgi:hypothetical protein
MLAGCQGNRNNATECIAFLQSEPNMVDLEFLTVALMERNIFSSLIIYTSLLA